MVPGGHHRPVSAPRPGPPVDVVASPPHGPPLRHRLVPHRLRAHRRVRRRREVGDPRDRTARGHHRSHARHRRRSTCAAGGLALARCIPYVASGIVLGVVDPGVATQPCRRRHRGRRRARPCWSVPTTGCSRPPWRSSGGAERAVVAHQRRLPAAGARPDLRRPRRVRPGRRAPLPTASISTELGEPVDLDLLTPARRAAHPREGDAVDRRGALGRPLRQRAAQHRSRRDRRAR